MTISRDDYGRAEQFLHWNAIRRILGAPGTPHWMADGSRFWYEVHSTRGRLFKVVDAVERTQRVAVDPVQLAEALTSASGHFVDQSLTGVDVLEVRPHELMRLVFAGEEWQCVLPGLDVTPTGRTRDATIDEVPSPQGESTAFVDGNDVYVVQAGTARRRLTFDGASGSFYGKPLRSPLAEAGLNAREERIAPALYWSPGGQRLLTTQVMVESAPRLNLVQSQRGESRGRPQTISYEYPLPGDDITPTVELIVIDVATGHTVRPALPAQPLLYYGSGLPADHVWWSPDGSRVYVLTHERGFLAVVLWEVDAVSGAAHIVLEERSATGASIQASQMSGEPPMVRILHERNEILWYSTRSDWGHLYVFSTGGQISRALTQGEWAVVALHRVDDRHVYFSAVGTDRSIDPYAPLLYRVSLDGGEPECLTPAAASHAISMSPSGAFFVDTYSRLDLPPISVLRTADGAEIMQLEQADIKPLLHLGWTPPERFVAKGRDGVTDIYGIVIRPTNFEHSKHWPVIDSTYPGPEAVWARPRFPVDPEYTAYEFWNAQAIAELGFVVVMIDGFGTPYRSRSFRDLAYQNLGDGGLPDHIEWIKALAQAYPSLDVDCVGIYGHSAGGYSSARAVLAHPDFFKVAVSSAGNHDHRIDKASWVERQLGLLDEKLYEEQSNAALASQLRGKLMLIHGDMDENVHFASTLRLVDALVAANKDFDLLILPNRPHTLRFDPYYQRRRWDYFVRHLLGEEPPSFEIGLP